MQGIAFHVMPGPGSQSADENGVALDSPTQDYPYGGPARVQDLLVCP